MENFIFSLSAVMGKPVFSNKGIRVALLSDVVCNKDTGRLTYFILTVEEGSEHTEDPSSFAIHHSYFYFSSEEAYLVFSPKLGNEEQTFFLELPEKYDTVEVGAFTDFTTYLHQNTGVAGHRSDND